MDPSDIPQKDFYRMQAFFASTRIDERPMPHLEAEGRLAMRQTVRRLEDELEWANESLKSLEKELRAKLAASKKPDEKKPEADSFQRTLADKENPVFTAGERKLHKDTAERFDPIPSLQVKGGADNDADDVLEFANSHGKQ